MRGIFLWVAVTLLMATAVPAYAASQQELNTWFANAVNAETGNGVKQDEAAAIEWYLKAAEGGHVVAMRNLAGMYGSGRGTAEDQEAAGRWFKAAAEGGDAQGQYAYANWYVRDPEEKVDWLQKAAQQNHREAIALLGELGIDVEKVELGEAPLLPKLAAICLQEQLNASGYSVGTVDGDIGPRSIGAARSYSNDNGLDLGELAPGDAEKWCRTLAERDGALAPFLAAAIEKMDAENAAYGPGGDFRFEIASDVPDDQIDLIKTGLSLTERYLEANLGGGIPQEIRKDVTVKVVATGRGNKSRAAIMVRLRHSRAARCVRSSM